MDVRGYAVAAPDSAAGAAEDSALIDVPTVVVINITVPSFFSHIYIVLVIQDSLNFQRLELVSF